MMIKKGIIVTVIFMTIFLTGCSGNKNSDKLTIYVESYTNSILGLDTAVQMYQQYYPESEINVEYFDDSEVYSTRIKGELLSGEGPDVIITDSTSFEDVYLSMRSGAFAPIDEYIETNEVFSESVINRILLQAGQYEGTQYVVPLCFSVPCIVTTQENVDAYGLDVSYSDYNGFLDMIENYYKEGNTQRLFNAENSGFIFMNHSGEKLVDYKNNTFVANSELIRRSCDVYKYYYEATTEDSYHGSYDCYDDLTSGYSVTGCFFEGGISAPIYHMARLNNKATPVLLSVPNIDGGIVAYAEYGAAIRNNSTKKEEAINFISILLSDEIQKHIADWYAPVRSSTLTGTLSECRSVFAAANSYDDVVFKYIEDDMLYYNYFKIHTSGITECKFRSIESIAPYAYSYYVTGEDTFENCTADAKDVFDIYLSE